MACIVPILHEIMEKAENDDRYELIISGEDSCTCNLNLSVEEAVVFNEILRRARFSEKITGKYIPSVQFINISAGKRLAQEMARKEYEKEQAEARKKHEQDVRENGAIAMAFKKAGLDSLFEEG